MNRVDPGQIRAALAAERRAGHALAAQGGSRRESRLAGGSACSTTARSGVMPRQESGRGTLCVKSYTAA